MLLNRATLNSPYECLCKVLIIAFLETKHTVQMKTNTGLLTFKRLRFRIHSTHSLISWPEGLQTVCPVIPRRNVKCITVIGGPDGNNDQQGERHKCCDAARSLQNLNAVIGMSSQAPEVTTATLN